MESNNLEVIWDDFSKIKFVFQNTTTHLDKVEFFTKILKNIRPFLNQRFREMSIRTEFLDKIKTQDYIVRIFFTEKESSNHNGLACIFISESGEVVLGCYLKRLEKYAQEHKFKSLNFHVLLSLIHEITHLFIEDEKETKIFSRSILKELLKWYSNKS